MMSPDSMDTSLGDLLRQEELPQETLYDPQYQGNMYLIEEALRDTGADRAHSYYTRSPYDAELLRLIDAVPLR